MLTLLQSTILCTILTIIMLVIGIFNFSYPRLSFRQIIFIFITLLMGFLFGAFIFEYIVLISFVVICIYLYKLPSTSPLILIVVPVSYIIATIVDNIASLLFFNIFQIDYNTLKFSSFYLPLFMIFCIATYFIISFIGGFFLRKLLFKENNPLPKELIFIVMINLALCCLIILANIFFGEKVGYNSKNIAFNCTLFIFYFCISLITMYQTLKSNQASMRAQQKLEQYESLKEYTANLEHVYNNLRAFKHDYINIMASISSFLEEKEYDSLEDYFNTYILPLKSTLNQNTEALNALMNVHVLELKSLLSVKFMSAMEKGIQITIDIPDPVTAINLNPIDLTRILGIYLDNAIEAATETEHPVIEFHMAPVHNCIAIIIANSFIDKGLTISEMAKLNVTSKGEGHGIGLHNVNQILNQHDTIFHETYIENGFFFQHMQIQNT